MMVSSNLLARGSSSFYSRMYSSLVENTIKTYQLAKEFNKTTSLMRLNFLENLESRSDGGLLDEKLRDSWARNIYGLARMIPDIEKKQRNRQTILRIPKFREMTAAQWQRARGPELVYWLAKSFGLLGPILPQDINVKYHVEINYGANLSAERGNFLVPSPKMMYPCIKVYSIRPDRLYSFIIVDADYPIIQINRRVQFCLWTKFNIRSNLGLIEEILGDSVDPKELGVSQIKYIPPIPARGSDTHRIVLAVFEHKEPLSMENLIINEMNGVLKNTFHSSRVTDIRKIVSDDGEKIINLVGLQFYRTCWTRTVSKFYSDIDVVEPVYGETLPIKPIQESVYNHVVE